MSNSKKKWSDEQKFKIVLELISEKYSQAEISKKYSVHPTQMRRWKDMFMQRAPRTFSNPGLTSRNNPYQKIEDLEKIIGQQTIEISVLKKTLDS